MKLNILSRTVKNFVFQTDSFNSLYKKVDLMITRRFMITTNEMYTVCGLTEFKVFGVNNLFLAHGGRIKDN